MDISLYFEERGEGFPLVLLHGNGEDSTYFSSQLEYFSKSFRVIAVDTRGHGKTPRGEGEFSIRRFVCDLHEFLAEKGIEKCNLLGFSDGGNIALLFAMKYPSAVNRLVLNGANLFPRGVKTSVQLPIEFGFKIARLFSPFSKEAKKNAEMLSLMVNDPYIEPRELENLYIPTLVIAGKRDMIKESHTRLIAEKLPFSRLALIDGDHFIASKNAAEFNREVEKFLNE